MAITQDGGHMHHNTVEDASQPSSALTSTGPVGMLAKSTVARLSAAYPASPIIGADPTYNAAAVAELKGKILRNSVMPEDIGAAEAYHGFATPESSEENPSSPDLTFAGAPNIAANSEDKEGNAIANPYVPNLRPPESFSPIMDNQEVGATEEFVEQKTSLPPFVGDGKLNPAVSSNSLYKFLVPIDGDAVSGIAPFTGVGSGGTGNDGA